VAATIWTKVDRVDFIGGWDHAPGPEGSIKSTATEEGAKAVIHRMGCPDVIVTFPVGGCVTVTGTIALVEGGS